MQAELFPRYSMTTLHSSPPKTSLYHPHYTHIPSELSTPFPLNFNKLAQAEGQTRKCLRTHTHTHTLLQGKVTCTCVSEYKNMETAVIVVSRRLSIRRGVRIGTCIQAGKGARKKECPGSICESTILPSEGGRGERFECPTQFTDRLNSLTFFSLKKQERLLTHT